MGLYNNVSITVPYPGDKAICIQLERAITDKCILNDLLHLPQRLGLRRDLVTAHKRLHDLISTLSDIERYHSYPLFLTGVMYGIEPISP